MLFLFCLLGMDLLKHGESAYPADAWVEAQYMKEDAVMSVSNLLKISRVVKGGFSKF